MPMDESVEYVAILYTFMYCKYVDNIFQANYKLQGKYAKSESIYIISKWSQIIMV
jgi:hypothetical protein